MRDDREINREKAVVYAAKFSEDLTSEERFQAWIVATGMVAFILLLCGSQIYGLS